MPMLFKNSIRVSIRVCAIALLAGAACTFLALETGIAEEADAKPQASGEREFSKDDIAFFEKQVHPILKARCLKCHGAEERSKEACGYQPAETAGAIRAAV